MNQNNKKLLAEKLKAKLNSPEYIAMPDLITFSDRHGGVSNFVFGWLVHGNCRSENKDNFIGDYSREKNHRIIYEREFEPQDWEEIVNLIEKRNKEKEQIWETKRKNIEQKLNQQSNLYYYWGKSDLRKNERADCWVENKGMRGFTTFLGGNGNGLTHTLYVAEEHPVLNSFSFQTGFYLIDNNKSVEKMAGNYEGGFGCSGGETNPCNWKKYIEVSDQITITPYEVEKDIELVENLEKELTKKGESGCDTCHKKLGKDWGGSDNFYIIKRYHGKVNIGGPVIWACRDCYPTKEQEYLQNYETVWEKYLDKNNEIDYHQIKFSFIDCYAGHKDQNGKVLKQENCPHCQPWKNHKTDNKTGKLSDKVEKEIIEWLIQYFQTNDIKHISLKNGELTITNNNKLITSEQVNNDTELKNIQNLLQAKGIQDLDRQDLNITNSQTPSNSQKPQKTNYTPYLLTGAIGIGLISLVIASYYLGKKRSKKNSY